MNKEELVELITKEVMARLKEMLSSKECFTDKKKVLILEKAEDLCPVLSGALRDNNYLVDSLDNMETLECYDAIVLQNISPRELANLANGIGGSVKETVFTDVILSGKRVFAMKKGLEYQNFVTTANKQFFNLFKTYEEKLKSYGVVYVGLKDLLSEVDGAKYEVEEKVFNLKDNMEEKAFRETNEVEFVDLTKKKLISEVELRNIYKNGINKVLVSKKSIVTPLAMDYARVSKVQIIKQ